MLDSIAACDETVTGLPGLGGGVQGVAVARQHWRLGISCSIPVLGVLESAAEDPVPFKPFPEMYERQ